MKIFQIRSQLETLAANCACMTEERLIDSNLELRNRF